jgi:hypothetical protein
MNNEQHALTLTADEIIKMWDAAGGEQGRFRDVFELTASLAARQQQQPRKRTAPAEPKRKERVYSKPKMRKAKTEEQLQIDANPD